MYNACLTGHNIGCSNQHKIQTKSCISQNDISIPQYGKISSIILNHLTVVFHIFQSKM